MTWTATEAKYFDTHLSEDRFGIHVHEGKSLVSLLSCSLNDPAAIEQMRARARLIVQAEVMRDLITDMQAWPVEPEEGSYAAILVQKARAIIKATGGENE